MECEKLEYENMAMLEDYDLLKKHQQHVYLIKEEIEFMKKRDSICHLGHQTFADMLC